MLTINPFIYNLSIQDCQFLLLFHKSGPLQHYLKIVFVSGTTERVCLITGSVDAIMVVADFIADKIREKPDLTKPIIESDSKLMQDRDKQVKILVPNSTAGMIIGKAGNYIKQIKESSGSYVQISQKAKDVSLQERCITVIGKFI